MTEKRKLKIGLIGLGNIGRHHIQYLSTMPDVTLVGVCDAFKEQAEKIASEQKTTAYTNHIDLLEQSGLEAVIVAVPHYAHPAICEDAFKRGIHVLCEKPLAVHVNEANHTINAYEESRKKYPGLQFGLMFQERTYPHYRKLKELLDAGELGRLTRATWIHTDWFRTQTYYDGGDWRATWAGEGGGILTNQCPHTLDMYQWLLGMPANIQGHAQLGKYHHIEVEDEVTAYFEHDNGMIGHLIVTTGESPGTNRLEIVGEHGKLVLENNEITFFRNRSSMLTYLQESKEAFGRVENWRIPIEFNQKAASGHVVVTEAFVKAILQGGGELIAQGAEGIGSVALANGIMLSSFNRKMITLPLDADEYESKLQQLIESSSYRKGVVS
ncbi:Gfo/Idh/MocA family protein [Paenibacillus sp. GCM10023252]|uniref:Gfo/Idh/MocA family protein n=1 Tax=Paenibacillus sp. GCM10023252 TaxID=3252649 RepID=UPI00361C31B8